MFGKARDSAERPRQGGVVSVIGADAVVTGDVATSDSLRIDGRVEGNVSCGALSP